MVLQFVVSLDGYSCDVDNGMRDVMMSTDDPKQEKYVLSRLWQAGTHIMGRSATRRWPVLARLQPSGHRPMNGIPKIVFSRTLQSAGWPEARIVRGDTADEIAKLKAEPGGGDPGPRRHPVRALPDQARPARPVPPVGAVRRRGPGRGTVRRTSQPPEAAPGEKHGLPLRDTRDRVLTSSNP